LEQKCLPGVKPDDPKSTSKKILLGGFLVSKEAIAKMFFDETKDLPFDALNEILDFVQFIKSKNSIITAKKSFANNIHKNLRDLKDTSLMHLEEEFSNYREQYPHES
jgi:hypothetical protein